MTHPPDCQTFEYLPACKHAGTWYWTCVLNSTIRCYRLGTPEGARSGVARVRDKRETSRSEGQKDSSCTSCLNTVGRGRGNSHNTPPLPRRAPPRIKRAGGTQSQQQTRMINTNCSQCIFRVRKGDFLMHTLVYHTHKPPACTPIKDHTCLHNGTMYSLCTETTGNVSCYDPRNPEKVNVSLWVGLPKTTYRPTPDGEGRLWLLNSTLVLKQAKQNYILEFDVCRAMGVSPLATSCGSQGWVNTYKDNEKYLCYIPEDRDPYASLNSWMPCRSWYCSGWSCLCLYTGTWWEPHNRDTNPCPKIHSFTRLGNIIRLTIAWSHPSMDTYGIGIDGTGKDPLTYITVKVDPVMEGRKQSFGWSVYDNLAKLGEDPLPFSEQTNNLFLELAEDVAQSLMLKNCFVCGGSKKGFQWPWDSLEAAPETYNNMSLNGSFTARMNPSSVVWAVSPNFLGRQCFTRPHTNRYLAVGALMCLGTWEGGLGRWNSTTGQPEPTWYNLTLMPFLNSSTPTKWVAPENMYWICGDTAYEWLPANWSGSCVLGWIKPSFFLLPLINKRQLGVPVYDHLGILRAKRESNTAFSNFPCKEYSEHEKEGSTWSNERIICYYGQAVWSGEPAYGYQTPIYMLNRIIRLQAVLHLAGERIDKALNILAHTTDQLRTAVYQNRLALDYLLAREGGVCGKFNLSNCCLEIDETGSVVQQLTTEMRQITQVVPQEWKGSDLAGIFSSWFPKLPGLQAIMALIGMIAAGCVILPCILPIFVRAISNSLSLLVEKRARAQVLALWDYHKFRRMEVSDSD